MFRKQCRSRELQVALNAEQSTCLFSSEPVYQESMLLQSGDGVELHGAEFTVKGEREGKCGRGRGEERVRRETRGGGGLRREQTEVSVKFSI